MDAVDKTELKEVIMKEIKDVYQGFKKLSVGSREDISAGVYIGINRYFREKGEEYDK